MTKVCQPKDGLPILRSLLTLPAKANIAHVSSVVEQYG